MIKIFKTKQEASQAIAEAMVNTLKSENTPLFCLAAGQTPSLAYDMFANMCDADIKKAQFIGLDEWVGVGGKEAGSCRDMMEKDLFSKIELSDDQIHYFDGLSDDLGGQCLRADAILARQNISLCILGVGVNGHIGFNEPGIEISDKSIVVELAPKTLEVGQKYFHKPVPASKGITLGLGQIIKSKKVIVALFGEAKKEIASLLLNGDTSTPVGQLLSYEHIDFYFDDEAADGR